MKKIEPITKGVANVPVVMQMEALECGAASLTMILAYYQKWLPLEQVRMDCGVSRDGSKAKNILKAARNYGMNAKGIRCEPAYLRENGQFPCIVHWNFNHFVVLKGFRKNKVYLNDPEHGSCVVSWEEFDQSFTGVCLQISPAEQFEPSGKPKSMLSFAVKRLQGAGTAIAFFMFTGVLVSLLELIAPAFSRVFLDRLLTGTNPEWLYSFLLLLAGISLLQIAVSWIQAVYTLRIAGKLAVTGHSSFLWHVLQMPMSFFSQRMAGDIQLRQEANGMISMILVRQFAPLLWHMLMLLFYLIIMLRYNIRMALVGIVSVFLNLLLSELISRKRIHITRIQMRDAGKLAGTTVAGIEMIETIKSSGTENGFFEKWAGYQASVNTQNVRYARLNQYLGLLPEAVTQLTTAAVLIMGIHTVMQGNFTIGMLMAFQGFLEAFLKPASTLIEAGQDLQEMRTEMERIDDVMHYPSDTVSHAADIECEEYDKLTGNVELRNVTFGYSRLAEPLIKDFSLTLKTGSRVAFVGTSGCGKSTLSKLISGLYEPWSGEILFDGKPIREIDRNVFTGSLAVVDQDIILFEDTIANNLKMWDDSIEDFEMIMAARDAQIHQDIMQRDGGYQYRIREGGKDFSGGQRQRMEIARVLAQDPTIIIMDEATSALDARTEYDVVKAIKNRGITCIVVAHRLSTIRDCDEIIVMDKGHVVERGTHEELYANGGYYTELISNE